MQIILNQRDIELSLKMYLASQGIAIAGRKFEVEFSTGRKSGAGTTAEVNIGEANSIVDSVVNAVAAAPELTQAVADAAANSTQAIETNVEEVAVDFVHRDEEPAPVEEAASHVVALLLALILAGLVMVISGTMLMLSSLLSTFFTYATIVFVIYIGIQAYLEEKNNK